LVSGSTPVHLNQKDNRSLGEVGYTIRLGYKNLLQENDLPKKYAIWNEIWNPDSLPKINIFGWQLAYNKLLTGEI
jgi:hypothetical protein